MEDNKEVENLKERVLLNATQGREDAKTTTGLFPPLKNMPDPIWDFSNMDEMIHFEKMNIAAVPMKSQERILVRDVLYCLSGTQGQFITPINEVESAETDFEGVFGPKFEISEQIHASLRDIALVILPLATHHSCVARFIHKATFSNSGRVLQALSAALNDIMKDYDVFICELETLLNEDCLSLAKLRYSVQSSLNVMEVLASVVTDLVVKKCRGGQALTFLFEKYKSLLGDEEAEKFVGQLVDRAAEPYMKSVELWINAGVIDDPQDEFFVVENELVQQAMAPEPFSADDWEQRYILLPERVPCFLQQFADEIRRTGKYLNVIRKCGKRSTPPQTTPLKFSLSNPQYATVIGAAYRFAAKSVLDVLIGEKDLIGYLTSAKRYLLLHDGEFITQFLDACEDELAKNIDLVKPIKLGHALALAKCLSSAKSDPYNEHVDFELMPSDLLTQIYKIMETERPKFHGKNQLKGLDCFAFTLKVKWPLSLILNQLSLSKYQMLFRGLFYCKHVERQLTKVWLNTSIAMKSATLDRKLFATTCSLRQRMLDFVQTLGQYMSCQVIETHWQLFMQGMEKAKNIDNLIEIHEDFLDKCMRDCMLTISPSLSGTVFELLKLCLEFCESIEAKTFMNCEETFSEFLMFIDIEFNGSIKQLVNQICPLVKNNPADRLHQLISCMNYNNSYESPLQKDSDDSD